MNATAQDFDTLARTVYGEARGEPFEGMCAVAWVVVNRVNARSWYGSTVEGVCKRPWQFSCWNANDPNKALIEKVTFGTERFRLAAAAAALVLAGTALDPTDGATHYFNPAVVTPPWASGARKTRTIGAHDFYRDVL